MVGEIRVYVEGGGDQRSGKSAIQEGFSKFLLPLKDIARQRHIRWAVIACGPRNAAQDAFQIALQQHANAFNVLLVDAEGPVTQSPRAHLQQRDGWQMQSISDEQCHLMVQVMESWLLADRDALREFYGAGFNTNPLPGQADVEQIDKGVVLSAMEDATQRTRKGSYHKIRHGPKLLERLEVSKVRSAARHCDRLFTTLAEQMGTTI